MSQKFKAGDILRATSKYNGKYLYEGIRATVEPDLKKVRVLDGAGKGRRLMADFSKFEPWDGQEILSEPTPKFKKGDRATIVSADQNKILDEDGADHFTGGEDVVDFENMPVKVTEVLDYLEDWGCFGLTVEVTAGDNKGYTLELVEKELNEFYEQAKKFRISFLDEDGHHHVKVVEAPTLESAREKVGPIKQEFYHMSL